MVTEFERRIDYLEKKYQAKESISQKEDEYEKIFGILDACITETYNKFNRTGPYYPYGPHIRDTVALALREVARHEPLTVDNAVFATIKAVEQYTDEVRNFMINWFTERGLLPAN